MNSTDLSGHYEAVDFSAVQEIHNLLLNPEVHLRVQTRPSLDSVPGDLYSVCMLISHFFLLIVPIAPIFTTRFLLFRFSKFLTHSTPPHAFYTFRPSHTTSFYNSYNRPYDKRTRYEARVRFPMVSLEFFIDIILPAALWPWGSTQPLTEMSTRNTSSG